MSKKELMSNVYETGMNAPALRTAVREAGGDVSLRYARDFIREANSHRLANEFFVLKENYSRLEAALLDPEWQALAFNTQQEFTRNGLKMITELARIMKIKNPIIKRGVEVFRLYVWAQGITFGAGSDDVKEVITDFLDDRANITELTGHSARTEKDEMLQTDGNLFIRFFTDTDSGRCVVRVVDMNEIAEIIPNPEDRRDPWFYKRVYTKTDLNGSQKTVTEYYPSIFYIPTDEKRAEAESSLNNGHIIWETPIYHVAVNRVGLWGVSEIYAALDWARAYKSFLENLASVWASLSRWAWKMNVGGGRKGTEAAKAKLNTTLSHNTDESNPPPVTGSVFIGNEKTGMQPFRTAGATMKAEDGRRLLLMSIAVFGFSETFWGDASVGTLATARSLDRPTELKISDRQSFYKGMFGDILNYVLLCSAKATNGKLKNIASIEKTEEGGRYIERLKWADDYDSSVTVDFPRIIEPSVTDQITAIKTAAEMSPSGKGISAEEAVRQSYIELGASNIDALMEKWQAVQDGFDETDDIEEALRKVSELIGDLEQLGL